MLLLDTPINPTCCFRLITIFNSFPRNMKSVCTPRNSPSRLLCTVFIDDNFNWLSAEHLVQYIGYFRPFKSIDAAANFRYRQLFDVIRFLFGISQQVENSSIIFSGIGVLFLDSQILNVIQWGMLEINPSDTIKFGFNPPWNTIEFKFSINKPPPAPYDLRVKLRQTNYHMRFHCSQRFG